MALNDGGLATPRMNKSMICGLIALGLDTVHHLVLLEISSSSCLKDPPISHLSGFFFTIHLIPTFKNLVSCLLSISFPISSF